MLHYSASSARKHFSEILNRVKYEKIIVVIGHRNKEEVLMVPKPDMAEALPISAINAASRSFKFLEDEPDMYSLKDLKKRYV
ncbi:hypothetical protein HZA41_00185 [Candidatus Peregrinibacteria bacterium]|nr:hypothetical protein [Candidatus Peregrinibacteria bacterium]